jgi:RNA polymerase sigma-70 factor (ECF subfamily)
MNNASDRELWDNIVEGDTSAFGDIFERHARPVYNYLFRRCGNWATAEDLASLVFLEAWRKRRRISLTHDSALPFLFGVATNVLRNHRRAEFRYRSALERMPLPQESTLDEDELVGRLADELKMREILGVFSRLPKREQDVLSLCVWMGLSYEEAATALDLPVGTVRSRLSRGKARLRELCAGSGHMSSGSAKSQAEQEGIC